ncbi:IS110 family transposase [Candidatus Accumulibacter phosphatis]|jgi:transposase|uniref:IS110 family transposase n=1 Tax=Candidatus Accumulibacter phosphatis TaxID=327160 RepID=A0ABX1U4L6_9PROT|nr:IS110 family transposase [Candidatus Accumulibacter phosphatis]NMQ30109.1 IS110 family transposase [Candidatus Accumulibacter phosphatis]
MELAKLYKRVVGLDVHQAKITACAITEDEAGQTSVELAEFGGFKRDRQAMAQWVAAHGAEMVVMESTGIYWKSPHAALEQVGIVATVVNARHVKTVPGRKTDWADAQWLAMLARAGMLRASFVPPAQFRALRHVGRQRQQLIGILSSEKNRVHKILSDGGIRLSVVVSDIHGVAGRAMVKALIAEHSPAEVLMLAGNRLKADRTELLDALDGELTADHRFVLHELIAHVEELERRIDRFDQYLLDQLASYRSMLALMQTIPGIDAVGAALLLVEIGNDMSAFGSVDRLASWVGICPGNNESAGKRKTGRIRKGNPWVRRLLCQFAHAASRTRCAFKSKFEALRLRRGHKRAIVAIAHKILKTVFLLISRQTHYRDSATDFEALSVARNAPRWLKMLQKHGFIPAAA